MTDHKPPPALDEARRAHVDAALAALVDNGDLDRIVSLARLVGSAQDSMTDDIVGRVAAIASDGMDLLDRVNRSGVVKALPAVSALVDNGDLDRVVELARLIGSAQDSMTDDMIVRLAGVASHGLSLVETMTRTGLADSLMKLAAHLERSGLAPDLLNAVDSAAKEVAAQPPPKGGIAGLMGIYALMKQPQTQRAIHFAVAMLCALCQARVAPNAKRA